jgi:hypothetical protein
MCRSRSRTEQDQEHQQNRDDHPEQAVAQLDEVGDERLLPTQSIVIGIHRASGATIRF